MTLDPRLQNIIEIQGPTRLVVGSPIGGMDAILNKSSAALAKAMTQLRQRAAEIRDHSQLLPSERARRLDELRPAALAAARAHQQTLKAEAQRITTLAKTASPVRPLSQASAEKMWVGMALVQRLAAMTVSEKTHTVARCMSDPVANAQWTEVLLQWPIEATGIDAQMREQLRSAALAAMDPQLAEAIDIQLQQVEFATRADELAQQSLSETLPGAVAELRSSPAEPEPAATPTAADFLSAVPEHVVRDLMSGPGLSRPSGVELNRAQA